MIQGIGNEKRNMHMENRKTRSKVVGCLGLLWLMGVYSVSFAQYGYRVGKGESSIEPGESILSLALAGYGIPRGGRFSLEWKERSGLGAVSDAVAVSDKLYVVDKGKVYKVDLNELEKGPFELRQSAQIRLLAAGRSRLFALDAANDLLEAAPRRGKLRWKRRGNVHMAPQALSYHNGRFVLLDTAGVLWIAEDHRGSLAWRALATCDGAIDVMSDQRYLYALTGKQEIQRYVTDTGWLRVAIPNGITYHQDIRLLAASGAGYWALDHAGVLYQARHSSANQLTIGALLIQQGKQRVAILGADVCGFDADFVGAVKQDILRTFGIPPAAVMVNASHTHFAPVTQRWLTWGPHCQRPDSAYLYTVVKTGIMNALRQAEQSLQPADLYVGRSAAHIGRNRSLPEADPPYDPALDVIRVDYEHLDQDDIVFLAGCHPVSDNSGKEDITISPNYPGVAREMLRHHSQVRSAMFLQGCGGDINPIDVDHRVTAEKVAVTVTELLNQGVMQPINGSITFYLDTIPFDSRPWPQDKIKEFRAANEGPEGNVGAEKNVRWADLMFQYNAKGEMPKTMPVFIQTFNIGNWKLIGISRETTTEYSLGIKALWPDKLVSVAGYCNDVSSYLPTSKHIRARTYEGHDSFFWYGQPNTFPENVYEAILEFIKSKSR